jgi:hypothetical protein
MDFELKYPSWQVPLREAVLEFDREKLDEKIQTVKKLIFDRLEAMPSEGGHQDERQALADAVSMLRVLKEEKCSPAREMRRKRMRA